MANYAQRKMFSVEVQESKPCVIASHLDVCQKTYKFYDIKFTANSYVYRQVCIGSGCMAQFDVPKNGIKIYLNLINFDFFSSYLRRYDV